MHIFIDESGIFKSTSNTKQWSSVGALAVPGVSLSAVKQALEQLKIAHGIELDVEFKQDRPDCSSEHYMEFLTKIDEAGCTLHILSTPTTMLNEDDIGNHKTLTKAAIKEYFKTKNINIDLYKDIELLVDALSIQNYYQCILQIYLIYDMLSKIVPYYSEKHPQELAAFHWTLDQKDVVETKHEIFFKLLYQGLISVTTMSRPWPMLVSENCNYEYFLDSYACDCPSEDGLDNIKNTFKKDMSSISKNLCAIPLEKLLGDSFLIDDSKNNFGLQCIDLLVSSTNRCLKQNYDDNEKMANALGNLMINSPDIIQRCVRAYPAHYLLSINFLSKMHEAARATKAQKFRKYLQYRVRMLRNALNHAMVRSTTQRFGVWPSLMAQASSPLPRMCPSNPYTNTSM